MRLWRMQRFFKSKRPFVTTGTAVTDQQKANLLATNIKNNFVENERKNDNYNQNDDLIITFNDDSMFTVPSIQSESNL
ncbi:hypothetical protein TNCV_670031 [Trichonephila clavipes]|nr:hypothetical protein TNCV_670031 [Trichonephila clavipes]